MKREKMHCNGMSLVRIILLLGSGTIVAYPSVIEW